MSVSNVSILREIGSFVGKRFYKSSIGFNIDGGNICVSHTEGVYRKRKLIQVYKGLF